MTTTISTNTRQRSLWRFDNHPIEAVPGTYSASIWDHETESWEERHRGISLMGLRAVIRQLESDGWSALSYLIERE